MPVIKDEKRKNAFTMRLKDKKEKSPDAKAKMTSDELRIFEKFISEAKRNIDNASCVLGDPSCEQAKDLDETLRELSDRIEALRYRLVGP